jgi:DNA gyrase subunit A
VRNEDFVQHIFMATNHNYLLFFTEKGRCYWKRAFEIPEGSKDSKGRAILNLINIEPDDKVKAYINVTNLTEKEYLENHYIVLCTRNGIIKKTCLEAYSRPRANGIIAVGIRDNDELIEARLTDGTNQLLIASRYGKMVRCPEEEFRAMGRGASGVKGITLQDEKDYVIGMLAVANPDDNIMVVSENGYGKRSELEEYRTTHRGGKGVKTINVTEKTGQLVAIANVTDNDDLMIINNSGITIRMHVASLRVLGRNTQGVKLIELRKKDSIASITKVDAEEDDAKNPEEVAEETANVETATEETTPQTPSANENADEKDQGSEE